MPVGPDFGFGGISMTLTRTIRNLRRLGGAAIAWGMMPLVLAGGAPTVVCACTACGCGQACSSSNAAEKTANGTLASFGHAPASCCGCCKAATSPTSTRNSRCSSKSEFNVGQNRCRTVPAVRNAVQTAKVAFDSDAASIVPEFAAEVLLWSPRRIQRPVELNTGPPIDLIVAFCHLVI